MEFRDSGARQSRRDQPDVEPESFYRAILDSDLTLFVMRLESDGRPDDFQQLGDDALSEIVHPDDIAKVVASRPEVAHLRDGESATLEIRVLHRDGGYRNIVDRKMVFSGDPDGAVELVFGIVACFRICQEALANVHRHPRATRVVVRLEVTESEVRLRVTDDGVGLGTAGTTAGVGIPATRERAGRLGGSVRLYEDEKGTNLLATIPA